MKMTLPPLSEAGLKHLGDEMHGLLTRLFPICRSITGDGVRQTLSILQEHIPIKSIEIPSGTEVFDWTVPDEWNISDAYILDPDGNKIVDFKKNNLHVLGYSEPVDTRISLGELKKHLYSLPDLPRAIPYLTSYYKKRWGFCLRHKDLIGLKEGAYTVKIDSTLQPGSLTLGEYILPGEQEEEVLISCYTCHPSMANDSLSGVVLATFLGKLLSQEKRRYTYRIIFVPETIGAITYLSLNKDHMLSKLHAGLVATLIGHDGPFNYKRSRRGNAEIDRIAEHVMRWRLKEYRVMDFVPQGSDERQYCSPGFNLPVGLLSRASIATEDVRKDYPQYHTSLDDLSMVSGQNLFESLSLLYEILSALEINRTYVNQVMFCEPFLSKRNLYSTMGSQRVFSTEEGKRNWILNYSDGSHDLLDIADKSGFSVLELESAVQALLQAKLIKPKE